MIITCEQCRKVCDVPDAEVRRMAAHGDVPCPACGAAVAPAPEHRDAGAPPEPAADASLPSGDDLKRLILGTIDDLPPMPQVAKKARDLLTDDRSSFQELARIIETDQAIAARVLKIANSAFYGLAGRVTSIQHASVMLGLKTLNEILHYACAGSMLQRELPGYGLNSGDLWRHSLAVAGCARSIAGALRPSLADDAFSAGLIHDCGKLILDAAVAERRDRFAAFLAPEGASFLEAEQVILGFDHAEIAAEVCRKWQIPADVAQTIQVHHQPSLADGKELALIVHAADAIALMSGIGSGIDGMKYDIDATVMETLGLDSNEIGIHMAAALDFVEMTVETY